MPPAAPTSPPELASAPAAPEAFVTWMHPGAVASEVGALADLQVRESPRYAVRVAAASNPADARPSFVYLSVPRSGNTTTPFSREDGADFAVRARLTMAWSTFLYGEEVVVDVTRRDGRAIASVDDVVIRPTTLRFELERVDATTIRIRVPYRSDGYRFSVEFRDDLYTSYNDLSGWSGRLTEDPAGRAIHVEPRHALLLFAEPMRTDTDLVPDDADGVIHYPEPGIVNNLDTIDADIVFFRPGIYAMPWNYHALLPPRVRWVHLAPGAYVKGAFEFRGEPTNLLVTGYGVLSGEGYVYEADKRANGGRVAYTHRSDGDADCHGTCVKMLQFFSMTHPQRLVVHGVTVKDPPYHSFVVYGDESSFVTDFAHYKQVGAWYWQTDGVEIYRGGSLAHSFLHSNDDTIKLYHSDVTVKDCVVWKGENGAVFQWGWIPREIANVRVDGVDIIHNRMYWTDPKHNSGIFNSARHWSDGSDATADPDQTIRDILIENVRSEGMNLCAMRLFALSNWRNIEIRNFWIESWNALDPSSQQSQFKAFSNRARTRRITIGNATTDHAGLRLTNYRVGDTRITKAAGNWSSESPGRLNFDADLWDSWSAE